MSGLQGEFDFYIANQEQMVEKYDGKVVVIKNCEVLGAYASHLAAFTETVRHHERGTFLIQQVSQGNEAYTANFYTPGIRPG